MHLAILSFPNVHKSSLQARFLDGRDGRFIDYTEIDEDDNLDAFLSRELEMVSRDGGLHHHQ